MGLDGKLPRPPPRLLFLGLLPLLLLTDKTRSEADRNPASGGRFRRLFLYEYSRRGGLRIGGRLEDGELEPILVGDIGGSAMVVCGPAAIVVC